MLGLVGQHVDDGRVEARLEQRHQLGADAVARNRHVGVGFVLDERDVRSARYARSAARRHSSSGRIDDAVARVHAPPGRAGRRRAASRSRRSRPDRRACGRARRASAPKLRAGARRKRRGAPFAPRPQCDRRSRRARAATSSRSTRTASRARRPARARTASSRVGRRAKLMIEMGDAGEPAAPGVARAREQVRERHGVRSARHRGDDARRRRERDRVRESSRTDAREQHNDERTAGRAWRQSTAVAASPVLPFTCSSRPERAGAGGRTRTADPALMRRVLSTN